MVFRPAFFVRKGVVSDEELLDAKSVDGRVPVIAIDDVLVFRFWVLAFGLYIFMVEKTEILFLLWQI